ncbi:hypothetical protein PFISCL1PPCAC_5370 [Pristionchus fissidentatus]|uniref:G protein-coupled receptor n=1 Tax=Pristionchus fissidentatus TaxID=1538716 RepID=A0AAV5V4M1_9BILA|nr:hypothetical protein PFISCL1PPCAC_5370 [Pristionchus fissidentatus]
MECLFTVILCFAVWRENKYLLLASGGYVAIRLAFVWISVIALIGIFLSEFLKSGTVKSSLIPVATFMLPYGLYQFFVAKILYNLLHFIVRKTEAGLPVAYRAVKQ